MKNRELRIYLAGPLFNYGEQMQNNLTAALLKEKGYKVYNPQEEVLMAGEQSIQAKEDCFNMDYWAIQEADIMIACLNGVDIDSGTASEIGIGRMMFTTGVGLMLCPPIGFKNDFRSYLPNGRINNFVQGCLYENKVFNDIEDIIPLLEKFEDKVKAFDFYKTKAFK